MNVSIIRRNIRVILYYLVFGGLTTLVNIFIYWSCSHFLFLSVITSTIIAWFLAILFSYVTNRKWVFQSQAFGFYAISKEFFLFFICRGLTGIFDLVFMFVFVSLLEYNDLIIKTTANLMVIFFNFVASKFLIFRKRASLKRNNQ